MIITVIRVPLEQGVAISLINEPQNVNFQILMLISNNKV